MISPRALLLLCLSGALLIAVLAPAGASAEAEGPPDLEVRGYQEDFGVSARAAEENLETQDLGSNIVEQLEDVEDHRYAGVWFDNEAGEFVVPVLTRADRLRMDSEFEAVHLKGSDFRTVPADSSWEELEAAQDDLNRLLLPQMKEGFVQTSLDPRTNAVLISQARGIGAEEESKVREAASAQGVAVEVREKDVDRLLRTPAQCGQMPYNPNCDAPMRGGVTLQEKAAPGVPGSTGGDCTTGFKALSTGGSRYVLTAGHCTENGELIAAFDGRGGPQSEHYLGYTEASYDGGGYDVAKINANASFWDIPSWPSLVVEWSKYSYPTDAEHPITSESSSYMGQYVCHTGISTATTCGYVVALGVSTTTTSGSMRDNMSEIYPVCVEGGDSGGPVFSGNTALGITSYRGEQNDECGRTLGYSEITEDADLLGVTVAPRVGAPPVAGNVWVNGTPPRQALIRGEVDANGIASNYYVQFGTTTAYGSASAYGAAGNGFQPTLVNATLNGLKGNTTYHYRLVASNSAGSHVSADHTFTTPSWPVLVAPEAPAEVKSGKAKLRAQINPQAAATTYRFEWGKTTSYGTSVPVPDAAIGSGTANVAVAQEISGLKGQTTYHYRAVATNDEGTTTSADQSFTTPDWRPAATTEGTASVKAGKATLKGKVNPHSFATTYRFEWGTQAEFEAGKYGHPIPVPDGEAGAGEADVAVSQTIEPIKGASTYHYRLVAENAEAQTIGADKVLTTPDWRPFSFQERATSVDRKTATLFALVQSQGFETTYHFEWGPTTAYGRSAPVPDESIGSGTSAVERTRAISGLEPNTTYHFRVVAKNVEGTRNGEDRTFTTSASGFLFGAAPATLLGPPQGELEIVTAFAPFGCSPQQLSGEAQGRAERLSLAATDSVCPLLGWNNAPLKMNGCGYELDPGAAGEEGFAGELAIVCPAGKAITIVTFSCDVAIGPQSLPARFENNGEGTAAKVEVSTLGGTLKYELSDCGQAGTSYGGSFLATWNLGAKHNGTATAMRVSDEFDLALTGAATDLGATGTATLRGSVRPHGDGALYAFQYGPTAAYGSETSVGLIEVGKGGSIAVEKPISGLQPNVLYHYRLGAINNEGTFLGEDRTFEISAPKFRAADYPASVTGALAAGAKARFGFEAGLSASCAKASLAGSLSANSPDLTLAPSFSECDGLNFLSASIEPNGCTYALHNGTAPWGANYPGTLEIACPAGKAIVLKAATCEISIPAQSGAVILAGDPAGFPARVSATPRVSALKYTKLKDGFSCPLNGTGEKQDGTLTGALSLGAQSEAQGGPVALEVSGVELGSHAPRIEAEGHPAALAGSQLTGSGQTIGFEAGLKASCTSATLAGSLASPSSAVALAPSFSGCDGLNFLSASIEPNGCTYNYGLTGAAGPNYPATLEIACPAGKAIVLKASTCEISIPAQSGLAAGLSSAATAPPRLLAANQATKLKYTKLKDGFACPLNGTGAKEDGTLTGTSSIGGTLPIEAAVGVRVSGS